MFTHLAVRKTRAIHSPAANNRTSLHQQTKDNTRNHVHHRSTTSENELDNFSYDPVHLQEWQTPPHLQQHLTQELHTIAQNRTLAGAAMSTSFSRIQALMSDAPNRADPRSTHQHLVCHEVPTATTLTIAPTPFDLATAALPPLTTPLPPTNAPLTLTPASTPPKCPYCSLPPPQQHPTGLDTPPFTPVDSKGLNTPHNHSTFDPTKGRAPDAMHLQTLLSVPLSPGRAFSATDCDDDEAISEADCTGEVKNQAAWEFYLHTLKEELHHLRIAVARVKAYDYRFRLLLVEHKIDRKLSTEALEALEAWWAANKMTTTMYSDKAREMEEEAKRMACEMGGEEGEESVRFVFEPPRSDTRFAGEDGGTRWL